MRSDSVRGFNHRRYDQVETPESDFHLEAWKKSNVMLPKAYP